MDDQTRIKLDDLDFKIINELRMDSQRSVRQLAKDIGESPSTIYNRIKRLTENNVVSNFTVTVDFNLLDLGTVAHVFLDVNREKGSIRDIAKQISELDGVYGVYVISGEYDIMVKIRGPSLQFITEFVLDKLQNVPGIRKSFTSQVFETVLDDRQQILASEENP